MKFLLTNDDGISSPGLAATVEVMKQYGKVFVVCPNQDQSGVGHSVTFREALKVQETTVFGEDVKAWTVSGTPADCVKMAMDVLVTEEIDFVVSGMNLGSNIGRDSYYSGTIAAAREASYYGLPAVAVSLDIESPIADFTESQKIIHNAIGTVLHQKYTSDLLLNINVPNVPASICKGIKFANLDYSIKRYKPKKEINAFGQEEYWTEINPMQLAFDDLEGDAALLQEGFVTVTPIEIQGVALNRKREVEHWFKAYQQGMTPNISKEAAIKTSIIH